MTLSAFSADPDAAPTRPAAPFLGRVLPSRETSGKRPDL